MSPAVCAAGVAFAASRRSEVLPAALSHPTLPIWAVPARIRLLAGEGCYLPSNLFGGFSGEGTSVGWGCGATGARWAGTGMGVGASGWSCLPPWCRDPLGAAARPLPGDHGHPGAAARHEWDSSRDQGQGSCDAAPLHREVCSCHRSGCRQPARQWCFSKGVLPRAGSFAMGGCRAGFCAVI